MQQGKITCIKKSYRIWMLFSIQGLGEADHSDRDSDSTGNLLEGQVPLLASGELQWKRGSGEVYQ